MAKSFDVADRYPEPSGHLPEQRSKATGGGKSPMDPMGQKVPAWSAEGSQTPGNSPSAVDVIPCGKKTSK
jgi:hypothetical protein